MFYQMLYLLAMQKVFLTLNKENIGTIFREEIKIVALWFLAQRTLSIGANLQHVLIPAISLYCFHVSIYYLSLKNQKVLKIIIPVSEQITFGGFQPWEEKGLSVVHCPFTNTLREFNLKIQFSQSRTLWAHGQVSTVTSGQKLLFQKLSILSFNSRSDKFNASRN